MYECPSCAANMTYSISKKMLYCAHCENTMDPYAFQKESDAEENTEYEVTLFSCPQCGGQLLSEDTTAATFCSFCGASTILDSRISKERKPKYIIPFAKTKANCKTAYRKMMRQAFFAPNALKDPEHIEKFRGIYMPYWVYSFEKKGRVTVPGKKTRRRGDYLITKHYDVDMDVDASYEGISFDASSTFSDTLSKSIAPFHITKGVPFTPSFLSGFYADTNDVDRYVYSSEARTLFQNDCAKKATSVKELRKYGVGNENIGPLRQAMYPDEETQDLALFPVWFLSYRKDDRIAYAVVNGQTGKASGDLPIDIRKFITISLLVAVPLFLLLNLFFTVKPGTVLLVSAFLAIISAIISNVQITRMLAREKNEDDKGMQYATAMQSDVITDLLLEEERSNEQAKPKYKLASETKLPFNLKSLVILLLFLVAPVLLPGILFLLMRSGINIFYLFIIGQILFIFWIFRIRRGATLGSKKKRTSLLKNGKEKMQTLIKPLGAILLAIIIAILNPVNDIYYYLGAVVCMLGVCWSVFDIIKHHNLLTTRPLPQLGKRGGDENA